MQALTQEQRLFHREVRQVERQVRQVERQLFPSLQCDSLDDQSSVLEGRRASFLRRSGSFLRRSIDDSAVMENTSFPLSLALQKLEELESEEKGLKSHSNHQPGLRLVSWDEEEEEGEDRGPEPRHLSRPGLLLSSAKTKKKTSTATSTSSSHGRRKKKKKEEDKYAKNLPKDHFLTPLRRSSRPPSPSPSPAPLVGSRSAPVFLSPSSAYLLKHPVLPIDEGKPSYARSTSSSRHTLHNTTTTATATATAANSDSAGFSPFLRLDEPLERSSNNTNSQNNHNNNHHLLLPLFPPNSNHHHTHSHSHNTNNSHHSRGSLPALSSAPSPLHPRDREGKPHLINL